MERRRVVRRLVRILLIVWIFVTVVTLWVAARKYNIVLYAPEGAANQAPVQVCGFTGCCKPLIQWPWRTEQNWQDACSLSLRIVVRCTGFAVG